MSQTPLRRVLSSPLTWLILGFLAIRTSLLVSAMDGVRFISEEMFVGAAAASWRQAEGGLPLSAWMYSPYEGGSLWLLGLTAAAQGIFGETLYAIKAPPVLLGLFSLVMVYAFTNWLSGRVAATIAGALMTLPPLNVQVQELFNEGNHYDATGFGFAVLLCMGLLSQTPRPSSRRLATAGLAIGLALNFSYQCLPMVLTGLLAWLLARTRHTDTETITARAVTLVKQGAWMLAGVAAGVGPHLWQRVQQGAGAFGLYGRNEAMEALTAFDIFIMPPRAMWILPFRGEVSESPLPFGTSQLPAVATIYIATLAVLLAVGMRDSWSCLKALPPGAAHRASKEAAFGPPWLALFPIVYASIVSIMPGAFIWYLYPLYPIVAVGVGVGLVRLWAAPPRLVARTTCLALAAGWIWLMWGHARGQLVPRLVGTTESAHLSRGYSFNHFARFFVFNQMNRVADPAALLLEIQHFPPDFRPPLSLRLGQSLRGLLPAQLEGQTAGWNRTMFFAGLEFGRVVPLVTRPGETNQWSSEQLGPVRNGTPQDECSRIGTFMGAGLVDGRRDFGHRAETIAIGQRAGAEMHTAYWFGRGAALAGQLDKDLPAMRVNFLPLPHDRVAELLNEAAREGTSADQLYSVVLGLGYGLGIGGLLAQHRTYLGRLPGDLLHLLITGIGMARQYADPDDDLAIIGRSYSPAFLSSYRLGRSIDLSREDSCRQLNGLPAELHAQRADNYPPLDPVQISPAEQVGTAVAGSGSRASPPPPDRDDVLLVDEISCEQSLTISLGADGLSPTSMLVAADRALCLKFENTRPEGAAFMGALGQYRSRQTEPGSPSSEFTALAEPRPLETGETDSVKVRLSAGLYSVSDTSPGASTSQRSDLVAVDGWRCNSPLPEGVAAGTMAAGCAAPSQEEDDEGNDAAPPTPVSPQPTQPAPPSVEPADCSFVSEEEGWDVEFLLEAREGGFQGSLSVLDAGTVVRINLNNASASHPEVSAVLVRHQGHRSMIEEVAARGAEAGMESQFTPDHPGVCAAPDVARAHMSTGTSVRLPAGQYTFVSTVPGTATSYRWDLLVR